MTEKKKIPCRVCGKLFVPCAYCQSNADVFRWRNFACSKECAVKYINDTTEYRESLKTPKNYMSNISTIDINAGKTNKKKKINTKVFTDTNNDSNDIEESQN